MHLPFAAVAGPWECCMFWPMFVLSCWCRPNANVMPILAPDCAAADRFVVVKNLSVYATSMWCPRPLPGGRCYKGGRASVLDCENIRKTSDGEFHVTLCLGVEW